MNAVASPFRFRDPRPADYDECGICGHDVRSTTKNPFPKHNSAVHDVWALDTYGMHAVTYPSRPFVEAWSDGSAPLPTADEFQAIQTAYYADAK